MTTPDSNLKLNNPAQGSTTSNVTPKPDAVNEMPIEKKKPTSLFTGLKREDIVDNQKLLDAFDEADNITKNGILDKDEFNAYSNKKQDYFNNNWVGLNRKEIEESFLSDYAKTNLYKTFDEFDTDKDRTISQQEYQSAFGKGSLKNLNSTYFSSFGGQLNLNKIEDVRDFSQALLEQARKADANKDNILTEEEWNVYFRKNKLWLEEITENESVNGKQIKNGYYTVQKGETLESIAKEMQISVIDLYNMNEDIIDKSTLSVNKGAQLKIAGIKKRDTDTKVLETDSEIFEILKSGSKEEKIKKLMDLYNKIEKSQITGYKRNGKPGDKVKVDIFPGMTRAQAEKIGGETLDTFNLICGYGENVLSLDLYKAYKFSQSGIDVNRTMGIMKSVLGDKTNAQDTAVFFNKIVKDNYIDASLDKNSTTLQENRKKVQDITLEFAKKNITKDNVAELSHEFYAEIKNCIKSDLESKESRSLQYHIERLKQKNFTEAERAKYNLSEKTELSDEQIKQFAKLAAIAEYTSAIVESMQKLTEENKNGQHDEEITLFIAGLKKELINDDDVRAIMQAHGLESIESKEFSRIAANEIVNNNESNFSETNQGFGQILLSAEILENADEEHIQTYAENNAEYINVVKEIANAVINNMTDGEQKTALQNAISKAVENISNGTVSSSNNSTKSSNTTNSTYGYSQGRTQTTAVNDTNYYATSPIMPPDAQSITELKKAAARYSNQISAPTAVHSTQTFKTELEKFMDEMHTKGAVMKAKFENMPLGQALSMVCDNINKIPEQLRGPFIEKFTQMMIIKANSHKDLMCKAYITGSENLRQFMNKNNIITERMIYDFFDKNESEIKFASKTLQVNYYKHKTEEQIKS